MPALPRPPHPEPGRRARPAGDQGPAAARRSPRPTSCTFADALDATIAQGCSGCRARWPASRSPPRASADRLVAARLGAAILALAAGAAGIVVAVAARSRSGARAAGHGAARHGAARARRRPRRRSRAGASRRRPSPASRRRRRARSCSAREAGTQRARARDRAGDAALARARLGAERRRAGRARASTCRSRRRRRATALAAVRRRLLPGRACRRGAPRPRRRSGSAPRATRFALPPTLTLRRTARRSSTHAAGGVERALKTLVWHERLAASPTDVLHTVYGRSRRTQLSYTIAGRLVGDHHRRHPLGPRRRRPGAWVRSMQDPPLQQPRAVLGDGRPMRACSARRRSAGQPVWDVSFFDPVDAGVVRGADRQGDRAHARARHDRGRALHAPRVRAVRRADPRCPPPAA